MKDILKLKQELESYNYNDLTVTADGSLRFSMTIHNAQSLVTRTVLLIGNADLKYEEFEIKIDEIEEIEIDTEIVLNMNGNYEIYISR